MNDQINTQKGNSKKGYRYTVTDAQIEQYGKLTLFEKFEWLEETNKFIYSLQTDDERMLRRNIGNMEL
jgi:hypothetical protein